MGRTLLGVSIVASALSGCVYGPDPVVPPEPPAPGAHVLVGAAELDTGAGTRELRTERLVLFVPEAGSGTPMYLHDTRFDVMMEVTFPSGSRSSDDLCGHDGCDLRVEADTGCAVFEYTDYFRPAGGCSDSGHSYTGMLRACPTAEAFAPELAIEGELQPGTILSDGRVRVHSTYPLDEVADAVEVQVDGAPHSFTRSSIQPDGFVMELGTIPIGSVVAITYAGTRTVRVTPTPPTALATTAVVTDLTLDSAPPEGAIDARGQAVRFEAGALHIDDEGHCPREPFVAAIALGEPGSATALAVDYVHGERFTSYTDAQLVRADGSSGAPMGMRGSSLELPVPAGTGAVWLLLTNPQDLAAPDDYADPAVLRIDALEWR